MIDFYSEEDQIILRLVAKKLGVSAEKILPKVPLEVKIIKGTAVCSLCHTETIQYMQLAKYEAGAWVKEKDLESEEITEEQEENASKIVVTVKACWNCKNALLDLEKEKLVEIILKSICPPSKRYIFKNLKELDNKPIVILDHLPTRSKKR